MPSTNHIALAEECSNVRAAVGRMLLAPDDSPERTAAERAYRSHLRRLLRLVREEECGMYLEVAGEIATH